MKSFWNDFLFQVQAWIEWELEFLSSLELELFHPPIGYCALVIYSDV